MKQHLLYLFLFIFFVKSLFAQAPKPCGATAAMTPTCGEACIICDIDGFKGVNSSALKGVAPPDFCTSTVHNAQWISFIAGSVDLTLEVSVSGCKNGTGLEIGIYEGTDCKNFKKVSNCDTDIPNNTKQTFTNTKPLVVGQYYFFVMDGSNGDICNYTVKVLKGSTKVSPLNTSGDIIGPTEICEGKKYDFENSGVLGAVDYNWTINGKDFGKTQKISVDFQQAGVYELCCYPSNACDQGPKTCKILTTNPIKRDTIERGFCQGKSIKIADSTITKAGKYILKAVSQKGCDSLIYANVIEYENKQSSYSFFFCVGDTLRFGNKIYTKGGTYQDKFQTTEGCDSIVSLNLTEVVCKILITDMVTAPTCNGSKNAAIDFSVTQGTPPFTYNWQKVNDPITNGTGEIVALNDNFNIPFLSAGIYFISVNDNFGNIGIVQTIIEQPDSLKLNFEASNFGGFNLACGGDANAFINTTTSGGTFPYVYKWNNDAEEPNIKNLIAGFYYLTVTDANGCKIDNVYQISEPTPIKYEYEFRNPDCTGPNTGKIILKNVTGGIPPLAYILNNQYFTSKDSLVKLSGGDYLLKVTDANGCDSKIAPKGTLIPNEILAIDLEKFYKINLGEEILIPIAVNPTPDKIQWDKKDGLSCYDCLSPTAKTVKSTRYKVNVFSKDGCETSDSVWVIVLKDRNLFIPNAFSPNEDGSNDRLMIFGGKSMLKIKKFEIFNRWGNMLYQGLDFSPNDPAFGWDGKYKGVLQDANIFTWRAEIEFIDGETEIFVGDSALLK